MKTLVIDIDDTIFFSTKEICPKCNRITYQIRDIDKKEIEKINELYCNGYNIILWTGRNWDCYDLTVEQLRYYDVSYDQLIMGKPQGIYIDKDALQSVFSLKGGKP